MPPHFGQAKIRPMASGLATRSDARQVVQAMWNGVTATIEQKTSDECDKNIARSRATSLNNPL
ncbi:MAG: hypothetical protein QM811_19200 [Pirellulales bacterium]